MRLLVLLALALSTPAFSGTGQVVNGGFNDAAFFGDSIGWADNLDPGPPASIGFASPGQGGAGNCIILRATNAYTLSHIYQDVFISPGSNVPFLDYYYSAVNASGLGAQKVEIRNTGDVVMATPLSVAGSGSFNWTKGSYNLSPYVGTTVRVYFAATGGPSSYAELYADSISVNYATYTPTFTRSPTVTRTSTRTPSFTASPTFTRTPTPTATRTYQPPTQIINGDFETPSGFPPAPWALVGSGVTVNGSGHNGSSTMMNMLAFSGNPNAILWQLVHVDSMGSPELSFWYRPTSNNNPNNPADCAQFLEIRDGTGTSVLATPLNVGLSSGTGEWLNVTYPLGAFVGQNVVVYFGCRSPGGSLVAANFDDFTIIYGTPTTTPSFTRSPSFTATFTATPTATRTATPTMTPTGTRTVTGTLTPSPSITRTFSITPTFSVSPTFTQTPAFLYNALGRIVAGPVPALLGQDICLYFDRAPASSEWEVFNTAGDRVARLSFGGEPSHCWKTLGAAPGLYYLSWKAGYAGGGDAKGIQKVVLVK